MFNIVLYSPKIPPNTGNIVRLCANTNSNLYLIEPLGFKLNDKNCKRAGLDYHEFVDVKVFKDWQNFLELANPDRNLCYIFTTKGSNFYHKVNWSLGSWLIFGNEEAGLPDDIRNFFGQDKQVKLPMMEKQRSLNLANSVGIALYEAWRQNEFKFI